jgi:hypothetical protein
MIKFFDIKTGNVYDGSAPYVHWFDDAQSTNINHIMTLGIITNHSQLNIELPENSIFKIIDTNRLSSQVENIGGIDYLNVHDLTTHRTIINYQEEYRGRYLYLVYIYAFSTVECEVVEELKINGDVYLIGADFYEENESLIIELINRGVEIPSIIQKAFYTSNYHEDNVDNILMNRKRKELLSNSCDIINNKGSLKSIYKSLQWFEYGDLVTLYELWSRMESGQVVYSEKKMSDFLEGNFSDYADRMTKTTFLSISLALKSIIKDEYDEDMNPRVQEMIYKWAREDMALKISLLGNFYQTYFMPIHMSLNKASVDDMVFTRTNKISSTPTGYRNDIQYYTNAITCNVKNNDTFKLGNVSCQVGPNTVFGTQYDGQTSYDDIKMIGVDDVIAGTIATDKDAKTFYSQLYTGVGCIVPFQLSIPLIEGDKIKRSLILINNNEDDSWNSNVDYHEYNGNFNFNLLCKYEKTYEVRLQFDTLLGHNFIKHIVFNVEDLDGLNLEIYKFSRKEDISNITNPADAFKAPNDWIFSRQPLEQPLEDEDDDEIKAFHTQYLPTTIDMLNHMLVIEGNWSDPNYICGTLLKTIGEEKQEVTYTVAVCKNPGQRLSTIPTGTYRNVMVFCPGLYNIELLDGGRAYNESWSLDQFTVEENEILCVKPSFKFAHKIEKSEWEFVNVSTADQKSYILPSTNEPYVAPQSQEQMLPGFYDVIFRYKLGNETKEVRLNSAFYKR